MVARHFLDKLRCPACGEAFDMECVVPADGELIQYGTLHCSCSRYPIVDGIVILRQHARIMQHLQRADARTALHTALYELVPENSRTRRRQVLDLLQTFRLPVGYAAKCDIAWTYRRVTSNISLTFQQTAQQLHPPSYANYLTHRFANPSFQAGIAVLPVLQQLCEPPDEHGKRLSVTAPHARRPLLDLACGTAHSSYVIQQLFPQLPLVAVDHNFPNLYLAQRFIAPSTTYVYTDLNMPLPFADDAFDGVFCLDAFHYIESKLPLVGELTRVVAAHGLWIFPHLHNALAFNESAGLPLSPEEYLQCFAHLRPRLFPEPYLLDALAKMESLDLALITSEQELHHTAALCLIGAQRDNLWQRYDHVLTRLRTNRSALTVNSIYRVTPTPTDFLLELAWPKRQRFQRECAAMAAYLPIQERIDRMLWERLKQGVTTEADESVIRRLMHCFVLVPLPPSYATARELL